MQSTHGIPPDARHARGTERATSRSTRSLQGGFKLRNGVVVRMFPAACGCGARVGARRNERPPTESCAGKSSILNRCVRRRPVYKAPAKQHLAIFEVRRDVHAKFRDEASPKLPR